jgi:hypothetical protein
MLHVLGRHPAGKVSEVFGRPADQQGAYDFLEHDTIGAKDVQALACRAMAERCKEHEVVLLALDGSSFTLTDETGEKGFGSIGSRNFGALGLKMLNALAITPSGQTIGALAQEFWVRGEAPKKGYRPLRARESYRWHKVFDTAWAALKEHAPQTRLHVLGDREADASLLMEHVVKSGCDFTIRAHETRKVFVQGRRVLLKPLLKKAWPLAIHVVQVPATDDAPARTATLTVRAAKVELSLRDRYTQRRIRLPVTAVWAREEGVPRRHAIDWLLYTTAPVPDAAAAVQALVRYSFRWRIEDFHKMLKTGGGCVEDSQLRSAEAVIKWATMHAIVASRAQRLRDLARTTPEAPAATELSDAEVEALVLLKSQEKRRTETISATGLTIRQAVRWIGDLGGFTATGASTKMPGSTVVARGLERVLEAAGLIEALRLAGKMR